MYRGDPRPELDDAWKSLLHGKALSLALNLLPTKDLDFTEQLEGYNTRVPASVWVQEATPNHTLVEFADDSGDHYAVLAVLHELHCLVSGPI